MRKAECQNEEYNWGIARCAIISGAYNTETRRVRWATHVERTAAERNAYRIWDGKPEGNELNVT